MRPFTLSWLLVALATAQYELQSNFSGLTFFDNFEFYTSWDPTFGYVHYVDQIFAQQYGMLNITNTSVSFGVQDTQLLDPSANLGRPSLRLITLQSWTHGLFILDLAHMPSNTCGVWPAVWMLGSGLWPTGGEIDIIEYVNNDDNNLMALHTSENCTVAGADELGTLVTSDCGASGGITGCTVSGTQPNNSGEAFNANGGGVYAMEWTSTWIRIWFFPRDAIPPSITAGIPDVNAFGTPAANFEGNCDIDAHFYNASMVFNVDFCGQYAGNVWQSNGCPMLDPENGWSSCNEFVALNPSAFAETYWEVNYLHVYQASPGTTPTSTSALSSVTPAISTSTAVSTALSGALGRTTSPTMSLAGTTPTITTGTFSETSSVLSVLSSLSTQSEASASSASSSLVVRGTSASSPSPASSSGLPFSTALTAPSQVTPTPAPVSSPIASSATPFSSTSASESQAPCTGTVCTSNIYVTVVQTITVGGIALRGAPTSLLPQHVVETGQDWNQFDLCNFHILPAEAHGRRWTEFKCTLTREEIFNGELVTETLVASSPIQARTALQFGELLQIDEITMQTREAAHLTPMRDYAFTGSFIPSGTSFSSTTLTACPAPSSIDAFAPSTTMLASSARPTLLSSHVPDGRRTTSRLVEREHHMDGPMALTKTHTSYITLSKVESTPTTASSSNAHTKQNAACSINLLRSFIGFSFLVAFAIVI